MFERTTVIYASILFAEILYTKITQLKQKVDVSEGGEMQWKSDVALLHVYCSHNLIFRNLCIFHRGNAGTRNE
jgi:hypothetical protein